MAERKVLIIDDDDALAPMLNTAFKRYKFKVLSTSDGAEGLEVARSEMPDLVLLSVELPVGNGFLVCKEFKQDADLKEIPIIITSRKATDADFDKHRKLKVRANDYLHKPFTDEELFQKVGNVVGFSLSPDEYTELEAKVHDFLEERGKLESEIVEKSDRISQLEDSLAAARADLEESKKKADSKGKAEKQLAEKDARIAELEAELEGLQERAEESVALQSRVTQLEKELSALEDQVSVKEAGYASEVSGLQEQNSKLGKQVAAETEAKDEAETKLSELQGAVEALESISGVSFEELGENIRAWKEAAESVESLNEATEKLSQELSAAQAELAEAREEIESLKETEQKLELAQTSLEEAQNRTKEAEEQAVELQRAVDRDGKKRAKLKEVLEKALAAIE